MISVDFLILFSVASRTISIAVRQATPLCGIKDISTRTAACVEIVFIFISSADIFGIQRSSYTVSFMLVLVNVSI